MPPRQQSHQLGIAVRAPRTSQQQQRPRAASARQPAARPRRPPQQQQRGSSLQTGRGSYYFTPGKGHTVTSSGYTATRAPGSVYRVQAPGGQQLEGRVRLPSKTYHRIVLAEFIATVLIIAAGPIVVPQKSSAGSDAVSVTFAGPLVRLTAVCVLFFILALMATGERSGKVAAAFGGLVLTGAAVNAGDMWSALASAVGAVKPGTAGSSSASSGLTATQNEQASGIAPGASGRAGI